MTSSNVKVRSWGLYPDHRQQLHRSFWRDEIQNQARNLSSRYGNTLAYGNGRSYGDVCLAASDHVLSMRGLNRFICADWQLGVIRCEAGMTLEELHNIALPRGWFVPVTPGTKFVTLGGAVANDVHGKNHQSKGTFGCHVRSFGLSRSDVGDIVCAANENPEYFAATIGGLGITGIIKWIELQLIPISSSNICTKLIRFRTLDEFFQISAEFDSLHEYSAAWVDCSAKGKSTGRGVYFFGDHAQKGELKLSTKKKLNMPFTPPISLINSLSLRIFNSVYYYRHSASRRESVTDYDSFFYPLDNISNWNRIYGSSGFQQYQCVIPSESANAGIKSLLEAITTSGKGSFLAVLKKCGDILSPGFLSFPCSGVSLALDFPQSIHLSPLFKQLDTIVLEAKGRLYAAKDAHMSGETFRSAYPNWTKVDSLRDPALESRFWQRVSKL